MDTHFEQRLPRSPARPELSLPGEDEPISTLLAEPKNRIGSPQVGADAGAGADEALQAREHGIPAASKPSADKAEPAAKPRSKRRTTLMTSAAVGLTLVAATGVFLISPYNHIIPVNLAALQSTRPVQPGATQHITIPAPVAPAANLARAPAPHPTPAPNRSAAASQPRADEMQEIVNLRGGSATQEARVADKPVEDRPATASAAPPAPPVTVEPSLAQPPFATPPPVTTVMAPAPIVQPASSPTPAQPTITSAATSDPVVVAATLQAAPMSTAQQVDVLNVVTELGTLLRNQRAENAQLRDDLQQMRERQDMQLNDFARRLSLAEARGAISAAMGAGTRIADMPIAGTPASLTVTAPLPPTIGAPSRGFRNAAATPAVPLTASPFGEAPRRYRVQAASPGLAMLAEVDRTGDAGNLLQVSIGDDVPGFGKVKSIAQQGAAWVLTAERGTIR